HLPKRAPAMHPAPRLPRATIQQARAILQAKPYLGAERLAWDVLNTTHLSISPSTMTRLKRTLQTRPAPPPLPLPPWRFYERHHPHSLWHCDFLQTITLRDLY